MLLRHGGNLVEASTKFNIPIEAWIDLSTGISPWVWPVPPIPEEIWQRLPGEDHDLEIAAAMKYGCKVESVLSVPGSQSAIQLLPMTVSSVEGSVVALPEVGYREHKLAWENAGHQTLGYENTNELLTIIDQSSVRHAVVINPNNPTGETVKPKILLEAAGILARRCGFLLVDEAFVDGVPEISLGKHCPLPGLVVLRSIGKFFGLAGVRLGFVLAAPQTISQLKTRLPLWLVSTNARWIGEQALSDGEWSALQSSRLVTHSRNWCKQLQLWFPELQLIPTPLFITAVASQEICASLYNRLARSGILVRLFESNEGLNALRFGLPNELMLKQIKARLTEKPVAIG